MNSELSGFQAAAICSATLNVSRYLSPPIYQSRIAEFRSRRRLVDALVSIARGVMPNVAAAGRLQATLSQQTS